MRPPRDARISELIEVVTGVDQIRHRYQQVQQAAVVELRTFVTAPFVAVPPGQNDAEPAAADRGIRIRAVLERAVLAEPSCHRRGRRLAPARARAPGRRHAPAQADARRLRPRAGAAAGRPRRTGGEPGAVTAAAQWSPGRARALFESVWRQAYPLTLANLDARRARRRGTGRGADAPRPEDPRPAARRAHRPGRRHPARPLAAHGPAPPAPPPGRRGREDPHAARLVRRPARLGLSAPGPVASTPCGTRPAVAQHRADVVEVEGPHEVGVLVERLQDCRVDGLACSPWGWCSRPCPG